MRLNEFFERLKERYPRTQYGPGITLTDIDDITEWITLADIKDAQLDILFNKIKTMNETRTMPSLGKIRKWWNEQSNAQIPQVESVVQIHAGADMSVRDIYYKRKGIIERFRAHEKVSNAEIDFASAWDDVGWMFDELLYEGWTEPRVISYMEKVKETVAKNQKPGYEHFKVLLNEIQEERKRNMQPIGKIVDKIIL